jgi:hypothetical protein
MKFNLKMPFGLLFMICIVVLKNKGFLKKNYLKIYFCQWDVEAIKLGHFKEDAIFSKAQKLKAH